MTGEKMDQDLIFMSNYIQSTVIVYQLITCTVRTQSAHLNLFRKFYISWGMWGCKKEVNKE